MVALIIPSPEQGLPSTWKEQCQFPNVYFHSLVPLDQCSKNKSTLAIPLIFQAPMKSPKEFSPALWTFNSFSNDLLTAWPPNDHTSSHVFPLCPFDNNGAPDGVSHSHSLGACFQNKTFSFVRTLMEREVRSKLTFLLLPPMPAKAESFPLRLSQVVCTPLELNRWYWWGKMFLGVPFEPCSQS